MDTARRRIVLFLLCAAVLLVAGFGCGYVYSYSGFYSPDAQLDRELLEMGFNSRVLHYANLGQRSDCRRELVHRLEGQVGLVNKLLVSCRTPQTRLTAEASVRQAQDVIGGRPITPVTR